jgi:Delta7-sterol 5-desaturase
MLCGFFFGLGGIISYILTNDKLYRRYYIENKEKQIENKEMKSNETNQTNRINRTDLINRTNLTDINSNKLIHPFNIKKYTQEQRIHYFFSIIAVILVNILAFESYLKGYTKLYFNYDYNELIRLPIDIIITLFLNSTFFYLYHRLAHTEYIYKNVHKYHHAFIHPEPFDSLIGHPLDHFCAGLCQIFPMYIYKMHILGFLIYSSFVSTMGIYEHSGIKIDYKFYNTIDHHNHHIYPLKNYQAGFPILIWDKLFNSYKSNNLNKAK